MCHTFFIHSSVDGHLGCFHVLAIVNRAAMNIVVHDSFGIMVFSGYMPSSEIAGSYGGPSSYMLISRGKKGWCCALERLLQARSKNIYLFISFQEYIRLLWNTCSTHIIQLSWCFPKCVYLSIQSDPPNPNIHSPLPLMKILEGR